MKTSIRATTKLILFSILWLARLPPAPLKMRTISHEFARRSARLAKTSAELVELTNEWKTTYGKLPKSLRLKLKSLHLHTCTRILGVDMITLDKKTNEVVLRAPGMRPRHWTAITQDTPTLGDSVRVFFPPGLEEEDERGGNNLDDLLEGGIYDIEIVEKISFDDNNEFGRMEGEEEGGGGDMDLDLGIQRKLKEKEREEELGKEVAMAKEAGVGGGGLAGAVGERLKHPAIVLKMDDGVGDGGYVNAILQDVLPIVNIVLNLKSSAKMNAVEEMEAREELEENRVKEDLNSAKGLVNKNTRSGYYEYT